MQGMESYSRAATERAMKVQEVILRALAKKITWWQAAELGRGRGTAPFPCNPIPKTYPTQSARAQL
jgi:hypothetical protein